MVPQVIQLPLDPTGQSANNLVQGETHTLIANRTYRAIAPTCGAFYAESLKVYDVNGVQLTDGSNGTPRQYYAAEFLELPSGRYNQDIYSIVLIIDPAVSANVSIDYQALGGDFSRNIQAIIDQIEALGLDNRPVSWGDILNKPSEFDPAKHLHDIGDVYGFEYVVHALDRIRDAIEVGDDASHMAIYAYVDQAVAAMQALITSLQNALNDHIQDQENPHGTTAAQVGAWTIQQTIDAINAAIDTVRIPFTPVQQGGGANQLNNKLYLGWDGARLRAQVDTTDIGQIPTYTEFNAAITNLQNTKQAAGNYAVIGSSPTFGNLFTTGTIFSTGDVWAFNSDERLKTGFQKIASPLAKIRMVDGILYRYRPELVEALRGGGLDLRVDLDRDYMGFLAQQVQKVAPEIVGPAPFDLEHDELGQPIPGSSKSGQFYITIQYDKYCALLNEAVKELADNFDRLVQHLGVDPRVLH